MSRQSCPHVQNIVINTSELCLQKKGKLCDDCLQQGPNLWLCLQQQCMYIGCSDKHNDHSTLHFESNRNHCIQMNLSSQRIWCYLCESEVFLQNQNNRYNHQRVNSLDSNDSSRRIFQYSNNNDRISDTSAHNNSSRQYDSSEIDDDENDFQGHQLNGLVGLKNIANTCYMNSALQALSNSPPLTGYFLECGSIVQNTVSRSKIGLAKSYHRLIKDMWRNKRRYIVPDEIIRGISTIHPMFRGYQQHDTQEFLRCFMDQLHEELKEVTPPPPNNINEEEMNIDDSSPCPSPSLSQSEAEEYETCDSGVSEQSSLSDELTHNLNRAAKIASRSPSPPSASGQKIHASVSSIPTIGSSILNNRTGSNTSLTSQSGQSQQQQNESNNANKQQPKVLHRSIISDIFDGKLLSSVQCLTCDRISTREETFQDLSLPIPGRDYINVLHQSQNPTLSNSPISSTIAGNSSASTCTDVVYQVQDSWMWWLWNWFRSFFWGPAVTLHDCMAAFFSADELKGDNMYSCEKCNKLRNGLKFSRVLALPEMLCVHLKRFRHDLSYSSKISSPVIFPLTGLDMRQYLHKDCKSKVSTYDLTAVICHHGTVGSGHYICYAKHSPTDRWFEYDDQTVTQVSAETVQNCEAYVLFYQKYNPQMPQLRDQAQEIINSMRYTPSDIKFYISRQWLNRFNTFSEVGPIDNWSILCQHGNLLPRAANQSDLLVPLPQALWDFFYEKFGGGPVTNCPIECDTCKTRAEDLVRRQKNELLLFSELRDEFQFQDNSSMLFAISMAWFRKWQAFARCETSEEPGPINNTTIALQNDTFPIRNVRAGSDYAQINLKLWKFFYNIYGGGPEIILRGASEFTRTEKESDLADTTENLSLNDDDEDDENEMIKNESTYENYMNGDTIETNEEEESRSNDKPSILKPTKTVSFEDTKDLSESDDSLQNNSEISSTAKISNGSGDVNNRFKRVKKTKTLAKSFDSHRDRRRRENNHMFGVEGTIRYIPDEDSINNNEVESRNSTQNLKIIKRSNGVESSDDEEVAELTAISENEKQRWNKKKSKSIRMK